jgi:hypothetical protein
MSLLSYVLSPDDIKSVAAIPFFVSYWPIIVGTVVMCVAVFAGFTRLTIPMAAIIAAVQAWHSGLFS